MTNFPFELSDNVLVVTLGDRLDTNTSPELEKVLAERLEADPVKGLVIDFEPTEYISSAGLRVLLMAAKKMKSSGGKLILCAMSEHVQEVFDIAGFTPVFNIEADRELAISAGRA